MFDKRRKESGEKGSTGKLLSFIKKISEKREARNMKHRGASYRARKAKTHTR